MGNKRYLTKRNKKHYVKLEYVKGFLQIAYKGKYVTNRRAILTDTLLSDMREKYKDTDVAVTLNNSNFSYSNINYRVMIDNEPYLIFDDAEYNMIEDFFSEHKKDFDNWFKKGELDDSTAQLISEMVTNGGYLDSNSKCFFETINGRYVDVSLIRDNPARLDTLKDIAKIYNLSITDVTDDSCDDYNELQLAVRNPYTQKMLERLEEQSKRDIQSALEEQKEDYENKNKVFITANNANKKRLTELEKENETLISEIASLKEKADKYDSLVGILGGQINIPAINATTVPVSSNSGAYTDVAKEISGIKSEMKKLSDVTSELQNLNSTLKRQSDVVEIANGKIAQMASDFGKSFEYIKGYISSSNTWFSNVVIYILFLANLVNASRGKEMLTKVSELNKKRKALNKEGKKVTIGELIAEEFEAIEPTTGGSVVEKAIQAQKSSSVADVKNPKQNLTQLQTGKKREVKDSNLFKSDIASDATDTAPSDVIETVLF